MTPSVTLVYEVVPAFNGWKVAVYMRGGIVDFQLPSADYGRVWRYRKNAEKRAQELRRENRPLPHLLHGLCCVKCRFQQPFARQERGYHCCGCDTVIELGDKQALR